MLLIFARLTRINRKTRATCPSKCYQLQHRSWRDTESIPNKWIMIGTLAVTSRGMMEDSMVEIADIITAVLQDIENESALLDAQQKALALCANPYLTENYFTNFLNTNFIKKSQHRKKGFTYRALGRYHYHWHSSWYSYILVRRNIWSSRSAHC